MLDNAISADQVRARSGVPLAEAQAAVYMQNAKLEGWTMADFQERTGMSAVDARALSYRFAIEFEDFDPLSPPVELVWRKAKVGWELYHDKECIGLCIKTDLGSKDGKQYVVEVFDIRIIGVTARVVMARVAALVDAASPKVFGGQPVHTRIAEQDGSVDTLFPKLDDTFHACRKAFDA